MKSQEQSQSLIKSMRNIISSLSMSLLICLFCMLLLNLSIREKSREIDKQTEVTLSCIQQAKAEVSILDQQSTLLTSQEQKIISLQTQIEQLNQQLKGLGVVGRK